MEGKRASLKRALLREFRGDQFGVAKRPSVPENRN
jgi:hypothetical protein